ncbi:MAG: hypothetical protein K5893_07105 [Prevotella sp.]|nr:hypothetical protein [Prevotella sp.]
MRVILVYRAPQFSPNSVEKDKAILETVGELLRHKGDEVSYVQEEELKAEHDADLFFTMARLPETLAVLREKEAQGRVVVNSTRGVELATCRSRIDALMRQNGIPAAPLCTQSTGASGYWLKRGDAAAQSLNDVQFAQSWDDVVRIKKEFSERGISDVLTVEHIEGDIVKFYGVQGTSFFRCYYPTDDGQTKFGDEARNGDAHHYGFNERQLQADADKLSLLADVKVYGGDCIVRADGSYSLIDFNDWPSFSRCRDEAAEAIAKVG